MLKLLAALSLVGIISLSIYAFAVVTTPDARQLIEPLVCPTGTRLITETTPTRDLRGNRVTSFRFFCSDSERQQIEVTDKLVIGLIAGEFGLAGVLTLSLAGIMGRSVSKRLKQTGVSVSMSALPTGFTITQGEPGATPQAQQYTYTLPGNDADLFKEISQWLPQGRVDTTELLKHNNALKQLHEARSQGLITQEEYERKVRDVLKYMSTPDS